MLFLILVIIVVVLGFFIIQQLDERRWQRYQFERDIFFRDHPLLMQDVEDFYHVVKLSHAIQRKIITELMLKASTHPIYKKIRLQRMPNFQNNKFHIQIMLNDMKIAELDQLYAQQLGECLDHKDFEIGRPLEVLSEIMVLQKQSHELSCQIRLNLPQDPTEISQLLLAEKKARPIYPFRS